MGCSPRKAEEKSDPNEKIAISIVIDFKDRGNLISVNDLILPGGSSIRDALVEAEQKEFFSFSDTLYTGIGHLLLNFNGIASKNSNYWFYCVNNQKAKEGIDQIKLRNGDVISWVLTDETNPCK